jgi:hypothetical protein
MAEQLVDTVFPMRILQIVGSQVFINRGEDGGLKPGDVLIVYKPGPPLIDPYTKEVLGPAEVAIGEIKVSRVSPKFTAADIIETTMKEPIAKNFIVRRSKP